MTNLAAAMNSQGGAGGQTEKDFFWLDNGLQFLYLYLARVCFYELGALCSTQKSEF
jgi:hypothetical protein